MNQYSTGYGPCYAQVQGRFFVMIEVTPPITYPPPFDFILPREAESALPTAPPTATWIPNSPSTVVDTPSLVPNPRTIPTLEPSQMNLLDPPPLSPKTRTIPDLSDDLVGDILSDWPSMEDELALMELSPPFSDNPSAFDLSILAPSPPSEKLSLTQTHKIPTRTSASTSSSPTPPLRPTGTLSESTWHPVAPTPSSRNTMMKARLSTGYVRLALQAIFSALFLAYLLMEFPNTTDHTPIASNAPSALNPIAQSAP